MTAIAIIDYGYVAGTRRIGPTSPVDAACPSPAGRHGRVGHYVVTNDHNGWAVLEAIARALHDLNRQWVDGALVEVVGANPRDAGAWIRLAAASDLVGPVLIAHTPAATGLPSPPDAPTHPPLTIAYHCIVAIAAAAQPPHRTTVIHHRNESCFQIQRR